MSDEKLRYFQQTDFRGGICTQSEMIKPNQLLDSRNVWSPFAQLERRPGVTSKIIGDPFGVPRFSLSGDEEPIGSSISAVYKVTPAGVVTAIPEVSNEYDVSSLPVGTRIIVAYDAGTPVRSDAACAIAQFVTNVNANNSTFLLEILTERGYIPLFCNSNPRYLFQAAIDPIDPGETWQYLWFSAPKDTITDLASAGLSGLTSGTGAIISYAITSVGTAANTKISGASSSNLWFRNFDQIPTAMAGVFRLQFANATKILTVATTDYSQYGLITADTDVPPYVTYGQLDSLNFVPQVTPALGEFGYVTGPPTYPYTFRFVPTFRSKPPVVAVVPQAGYAFCAYQYAITQHYVEPLFNRPNIDPPNTPASSQSFYGPSTTNPYAPSGYSAKSGPNAQRAYASAILSTVNQDPALTGPTDTSQGQIGIWPRDTVPQLQAVPAANIIVYWKNTLFAADIFGDSQAIRWTTDVSSGGWNIWPEISRTVLSTSEDNSGITAVTAMGDNLVIFKKNSIWLLIDNGVDENNIVNFEPRRVVTGVGTLSHQSVQAVPQGLMFMAEDGFYIFDGTPNIKRVSDDILRLFDKITPVGKVLANATSWRTKHYYLCATQIHSIAPTDDANDPANNVVFAYNYQSGAWECWDGWQVTCWYQEDGLGLQENLWYFDRRGRGYKLGIGSTDDGEQFETMALTNRFGEDEMMSKTAREIRVGVLNNNGPIQTNVIYDDIDDFYYKPITVPLTAETQYSAEPPYNTSAYAPQRRRERKIPTPFVTGKWHQVELKNFNELYSISLGVENKSNR